MNTDPNIKVIKHIYKLKRGQQDAVEEQNPTPLSGEPIVIFGNDGETRLKIGDGETPVNDCNIIGENAGEFADKTNSDEIFRVGNGTDDEHRSNAFTVNKDGTASVLKGPEEDNNVATKKYVDDNAGEIQAEVDELIDFKNRPEGFATEEQGEKADIAIHDIDFRAPLHAIKDDFGEYNILQARLLTSRSTSTNGSVQFGVAANGELTGQVDISGKQNKTDNNLQTTDKTVVGAINELNTNKQDNIAEVQTNSIIFDDKQVVFPQVPTTGSFPENPGDLTTKSYVDEVDNNLQQQIDAIAASSDVVDVVGTYAKLEQYDTSHLKDNDIVKVLQDESRNFATTYYRWIINQSTHIGSWNYIGSEGPYYTKSETDTLLDAKANTSSVYDKTTVDTKLEGKVDKATAQWLSTNTDYENLDKIFQCTTTGYGFVQGYFYILKFNEQTLFAEWERIDVQPETDLSNYYNKTETDALLDSKENIIRDITDYVDYTLDTNTNEVTITNLKSGVTPSSLVGRFNIPSTIEGKTVTTIGGTCFYNCVNADFILPSTLTIIEDGTGYAQGAFSNTKITNANPNPNMYVGVGAFYGCNYISSLDIPYGATTRNGCYMNCKNLKTVIIEEGISALASNVFAGCENIYYVKLPETLTALGQTVFWNNHSLKKLYIPISLINVVSNSFLNDVFEYVYFGGTQDEWNASTRNTLRNIIQAMTGVQIYYNQRPAIMQDVINGGGGSISVDQHYDPTSTNAQSGTAVAEATKIITDEQDNSFNTTLHNGLIDYTNPCIRFSELMSGDTVNNIPAVDKCEAFLFFTDPHVYPLNAVSQSYYREYLGQIQQIYRNTPTTFTLCGGDWLESGDTPSQACFKLGSIAKTCKTMFEPFYGLIGNHDTNYQGKKDYSSAINTTRLPNTSLNNLMYDGNKSYYTFDGSNTRFYCFDTQVTNQALTDFDNYFYNQAESFANDLLNETSEHIAIALHIYFELGGIPEPEVISLINNKYTVSRHPINEPSIRITNNDGTITRVLNTDYTVDFLSGEITSINLQEGDKVTYYYYNGLNNLTRLLMQIVEAFNKRISITFNNNTYDFSTITSNSKVQYIMAGHVHTNLLAYHTYENITLLNDQYTILNNYLIRNSIIITNSSGTVTRNLNTNYTVDWDTGTVTSVNNGLQDGDIIYYDYAVESNTSASNNSIPIILTTTVGRNDEAYFDLVFVDYDNDVIKTVGVGSNVDRMIYMGVTNNE